MPAPQELTSAQQQLYDWLQDYIASHRHSPSIRQMVEAMGLRSPAPIQSRLRHLQQKGWITWQEGQARTLQLLGGSPPGIPVLGPGEEISAELVAFLQEGAAAQLKVHGPEDRTLRSLRVVA